VAATGPAASPGTSTGVSTYNDGTAAYRKKDFPAARDRFQEATHTTDIALQEDAYYDLGNARYRVGQKSVPQDRHAALEAWKSAIVAYDGALALRPTDADARFNRDLVARRVAALEEEDKKPGDPKQDQQKQHQTSQQDQNDREKPKDQKNQPQSSSGRGQKDQKDQKGPELASVGEGPASARAGGFTGFPGAAGKDAARHEGTRTDQHPGPGSGSGTGRTAERHCQ
jgi:tetratricopeptide (TPR) repeat protein